MARGLALFELTVLCSVVLGPLLSFVVFDRKKTRRALTVDYAVIAVAQVSALAYGVWKMAESRPAYVAFSTDRYEVVSAADLKPAELAQARDPRFGRVPLSGPRYVAVDTPPSEREDSLWSEIGGNPPFVRPKWYVEQSSALPRILQRARRLSELESAHPEAGPLIDAEVTRIGLPRERLRWLPVGTRRGFWTAIIDSRDGLPVGWLDYDPY